ncbi:hypothetical protein ebA360 [Aromatoleum aromaticum EbN1]|uniref:Uncharacterized protein n=1 Tax=Aromatoleum aromaticum (strain DSM 19018 / LMG 30748 / EbN1) TaxID=76114 RepID=Q5P8P8_AROAE|nr:hypothetical protein ebA360 [Aromatoleum aromaticum EbN1]
MESYEHRDPWNKGKLVRRRRSSPKTSGHPYPSAERPRGA